MKYYVTVEETYSQDFEIMADDDEEAEKIALKLFKQHPEDSFLSLTRIHTSTSGRWRPDDD